ncbi:aspartate aminotransferase [Actinopolyspora alba]|uniref:Aminotransferase n=1 Tax=Actinopolyspora alba TaxID=673379 RepID=A0A1I1VQ70_9ACTN|nr:pyridoxal phosphate-dependent aminotransferase [Actinopolyspora alba]SFD84969.1 aspartate aminotransferase [Actinopolyspora alba]
MSTSSSPAMSATLAADALLDSKRAAGQHVISMASGEIGVPVHPSLAERLAQAAHRNSYGPVAGSAELRTAVAGYWQRRDLEIDPDLVMCGPGSKSLLFAVLLALGGSVVIPRPSWVSYAAQAALAGQRTISCPVLPGQGGVPDPDRLHEEVTAARADGHEVRAVVVTLPDNPTGTFASSGTVRRLCAVAQRLDLVIISDEIYCDLVFDSAAPPISPAAFAPERTIVTTGLTKNLALGGWRLGVARLPDGPLGHTLRDRLLGIASQIWSSPAAPVQRAAAYAFQEPPEISRHVAALRGLHQKVARAVAERFTAVGTRLEPVRATCYLYPDFEPLRSRLAARHDVHTGAELTSLLLERYGIGVLPGSEFGEPASGLRLRAATSRLYGESDEQRAEAVRSPDPLSLPWIRSNLDRIGEVLTDLIGSSNRDSCSRTAPSTPPHPEGPVS